MTINYELKFFDYWHISSGLSGGSALDSYVVKDSIGLPYVPGKTIKGLVREAAELLWGDGDKSDIDLCFGSQGSKKEQSNSGDERVDNDDTTQAQCYFSSATVDEEIAAEITSNELESNLFEIISATKIDENGIAADKSLRDIEVVLPITLIGRIENIDDKFVQNLVQALKSVKRMGLNRNRGLGRCEFKVKEL